MVELRTGQSAKIRWRFRVWAFCVAAVAIVSPAAIVAGRTWPLPSVHVGAFAAVSVVDAAILLLIATTPADAIRLPVRTSARLIGGLTLWTWAVQWATPTHRWTDLGFVLVGAVSADLLATALAMIRRTPWWAGVLFWSPLALGPYAVPNFAVDLLAMTLVTALGLLARSRRLAAR